MDHTLYASSDDDHEGADRCTLTACRTCTPCAHDQHDRCRGVSYCHIDREIRACECCGDAVSRGIRRGALMAIAPDPTRLRQLSEAARSTDVTREAWRSVGTNLDTATRTASQSRCGKGEA